jgi:hypothetical protein
MIRRLALLLATVAIAVMATSGMALASTASPSQPQTTAVTTATPITQCTQLQWLGTSAVAACNLGPPSAGFVSSLLHNLNPSNWLNGANNTCQPGLPMPESASGSSLLAPAPAAAGHQTLWSSYGTSGLFWAPFNLQCSQWEDLLGNSWANGMFTAAKVITATTLTVVHAATTPGLLNGIQATVDKAIVAVGNTAKQWMIVIVMLGGMYMGWALLKHRSREVLTSALHMIVFAVPLLLLVAMPQLWTGIPAWVINSSTQVTSDIFTTMPATGSGTACLATAPGDPGSAGEGLTAGDHGASALWGFMACRPWLAGEFTDPSLQSQYGRALLFSQSFAAGESQTAESETLKGKLFGGIDNEINQHNPGAVDIFEGNLWQQRMMIASLATLMDLVLAAVFIGLACMLLFAQIGFYLLMVAAPVILLIGMYPGTAGRVFCLRWYERMLGLLAKMAIATVLLTGMLWVFGVLAGLSSAWLIQGLLIIGAGTVLLVKRKKIISGAVSAKGDLAARITGAPAQSSSAAASKSSAPRRVAETALGAAAVYGAAQHHAAHSQEQSTVKRTVKSGQKLAAAYATGGLSAAGTAAGGMVHGHAQRRKDARQEQAARNTADAAAKEQQWRTDTAAKEQQRKDEVPAKVHQKMATDLLQGKTPGWKAAPPQPGRHRDTIIRTSNQTTPKPQAPPEEHHESANGNGQQERKTG